jgi:glutathione S-transferase
MPSPAEKLVLRSTVTSPFGRKVRMVIDILELESGITVMPADTLDESDTLRLQNPLGKMPCLLLPDGAALYDSRVIIDYLQDIAGTERLCPRQGEMRYRLLTRATLADGVADAALLMVYEGRFREPGTHSERWLSHQRGKINRALAAFERDLPSPDQTDIVSISLACALGYLDWRQPVVWRTDFPALAGWLAAFAAHERSYARTSAVAPA